jgi:hypothetical protein
MSWSVMEWLVCSNVTRKHWSREKKFRTNVYFLNYLQHKQSIESQFYTTNCYVFPKELKSCPGFEPTSVT